MKITVLCILLAGICSPIFAQRELSSGYYVVVGAYNSTREEIAKNFVDQLKAKGVEASYGFNSPRKLFFVYLKYFTDLKQALVEMKEVRQNPEFKGAWIRVVAGDIGAKPEEIAAKPTEVIEPAQKNVEPVITQENVVVEEEIIQYPTMTLGNTEVFLSLFYGDKNRVVEGEIQVFDTERNKFITRVKGNDYLILPDPKSTLGHLTLVCDVFGYRKMQYDINYPLPLIDTVKDYVDLMGTTIVVTFDLQRYKKGDISSLNNVNFFNDAAIVLPESKKELDNLVQMMNENPTSRIRLHGHTNGSFKKKIIILDPKKNFFTLEGSKETTGSDMELSMKRAETIRDYLVKNGVASDRMEVKAWGGQKPLAPKNTENEKRNVRVEVEVIQE
jgi:outer membrane protein OmpA-like peptidoglycan-associated protein